MDNCWLAVASDPLGPALACGGSPAEPVGRVGVMVVNDSPDGYFAAVAAGAVGVVSTLADVAGTIAAAVGLLPYPAEVSERKIKARAYRHDYFRGKYFMKSLLHNDVCK